MRIVVERRRTRVTTTMVCGENAYRKWPCGASKGPARTTGDLIETVYFAVPFVANRAVRFLRYADMNGGRLVFFCPDERGTNQLVPG